MRDEAIIEELRRQKARLSERERTTSAELHDERVKLRRLMEDALAKRYRQADLARALGISSTRVGELLADRPAGTPTSR